MFAKLKKKVEESEGSDLHKLANSIGSATASLAEKTFSMASMKSNENLGSLSAQSQRGSTSSLASLSGATIPSDSELQQKLETKWKQKFMEVENEWRAKVIIKEHEKEELCKQRATLQQQKKQLEENAIHQSNESASLQTKLSEAEEKIKELTSKSDRDGAVIEELRMKMIESTPLQEIHVSESQKEQNGLMKELELERQKQSELILVHKEESESLKKQLEAEQARSQTLMAELDQLNNERRKAVEEVETQKLAADQAIDRMLSAVKEKDTCLMRNAELSQQLSLCQQQLQRTQKELTELSNKWDQTIAENENLKRSAAEAESSGDGADRSVQLQLQMAELEATVQEKNKTIKLQQQRLSDMKKTLQKELKGQSTLTSETSSGLSPLVGRKNPGMLPPVSPGALSVGSGSNDVDADDSSNHLEQVNFKYLKHVIFKFLTSREYEAQHLTRAVSTLLKLSPEEDRLLKETLEWKMSWFRTKPDLGSGQKAMYIPPSY